MIQPHLASKTTRWGFTWSIGISIKLYGGLAPIKFFSPISPSSRSRTDRSGAHRYFRRRLADRRLSDHGFAAREHHLEAVFLQKKLADLISRGKNMRHISVKVGYRFSQCGTFSGNAIPPFGCESLTLRAHSTTQKGEPEGNYRWPDCKEPFFLAVFNWLATINQTHQFLNSKHKHLPTTAKTYTLTTTTTKCNCSGTSHLRL